MIELRRIFARLNDGQSPEAAEQGLRAMQPQIREATVSLQRTESKAGFLAESFTLQPADRRSVAQFRRDFRGNRSRA